MGACSCIRGEDTDIFSTSLSPNQPADFHIQRADAYFNLISGNDAEGNPLQGDFVKPEYSKYMVRWLLLTGKNNGWSEEWELIDSTQAVSIPHVVKNRVYRFPPPIPLSEPWLTFIMKVLIVSFGFMRVFIQQPRTGYVYGGLVFR